MLQHAHRTHTIKTRVTEEEHTNLTERLTAYGMSQSEFIGQAIRGVTVKPPSSPCPLSMTNYLPLLAG